MNLSNVKFPKPILDAARQRKALTHILSALLPKVKDSVDEDGNVVDRIEEVDTSWEPEEIKMIEELGPNKE